jgi:hypothetical protein
MIQFITSQTPQSKQHPRSTPDVSLRVAATRTSTTAGRRDRPRAGEPPPTILPQPRAFPRLLGAGRARAREVAFLSRSVVGAESLYIPNCRAAVSLATSPSPSSPVGGRRRRPGPDKACDLRSHAAYDRVLSDIKKSDLIARCLARPAVAYRSLPRRWTLELRQKQRCMKFQTCS